jgi:magnesium-transporting ATPase (P-type)
MGFKLLDRTKSNIRISIKIDEGALESVEDYQIMAEMPFDSTRKRMSLVIRDDCNNHYILTKVICIQPNYL